jgi:hypothetical protein
MEEQANKEKYAKDYEQNKVCNTLNHLDVWWTNPLQKTPGVGPETFREIQAYVMENPKLFPWKK